MAVQRSHDQEGSLAPQRPAHGVGSQELVRRMEAGTPAATVAKQMNVSRDTVYKWHRQLLVAAQAEDLACRRRSNSLAETQNAGVIPYPVAGVIP